MSEVQEKRNNMKWYYFIIWFYLYAVAVIGVFLGVGEITGMVYLGMAEDFYTVFPMLRILNVFFGVVQLVLAVTAFYIRSLLFHFKQVAPRFLLLYQGVSLFYTVFYSVTVSLILGMPAFDVMSVAMLAVNGVLIAVNKRYFDKRMDQFVY